MSSFEWARLKTLVVVLLVLQAVSAFFAWTLNPLSQSSEEVYALLLAVNLVAFSMVSYINRAEIVNAKLILVGCSAALILMLLVLAR